MEQDHATWLSLLEREALGELTPSERELLALWRGNASFFAWEAELDNVGQSMGTAPPIPRSVTQQTASQIALSAMLSPPPIPQSVQHVASDIALDAQLRPPAISRSIAAAVATQIANEAAEATAPVMPEIPIPMTSPRHNPAPLLLVLGLLSGLTLLGLTHAWPNLVAGAQVVQTLAAQASPLALPGLLLLLLVSAFNVWPPKPALEHYAAPALALSVLLALPPVVETFTRSGVSVGHDVVVRQPVRGNVIVLGGDVYLEQGAQVSGEVITFLGDVQRKNGAQVAGRVHALLGRAPGDGAAVETAPPSGLRLASASAVRPLLGWLGGAAWQQLFVTLTSTLLLLLFVTGFAPKLARRQRHAPWRTLALGILALAVLTVPAFSMALVGLMVPALLTTALTLLLIATGLSVSAYDAGRALSFRLRLPVPDVVGAVLGLCAIAASLALPPLALGAGLLGGAWGMGTLLLSRDSLARLMVE